MSAEFNPLLADGSFSTASAIAQSGECGQMLGVYAVVRSRSCVDDPLSELGLPLVHALLDPADPPVRVVAISTAAMPDIVHWSIVVALDSGVTLSIDLGVGFGRSQPQELDLRIEWSGTERVVVFEPARVAVTVANEFVTQALSAEVIPLAAGFAAFRSRAARIAAGPSPGWEMAAAVIAAARFSASSLSPVSPV